MACYRVRYKIKLWLVLDGNTGPQFPETSPGRILCRHIEAAGAKHRGPASLKPQIFWISMVAEHSMVSSVSFSYEIYKFISLDQRMCLCILLDPTSPDQLGSSLGQCPCATEANCLTQTAQTQTSSVLRHPLAKCQ